MSNTPQYMVLGLPVRRLGPDQVQIATALKIRKIGAGFRNFPGGKVESGQSVHEALCDEFKTELGGIITSKDDVEQIVRAYVYFPWNDRDVQFVIDTFLIRNFRGILQEQASGEMTDPRWHDFPQGMPWDEMLPSDRDWIEDAAKISLGLKPNPKKQKLVALIHPLTSNIADGASTSILFSDSYDITNPAE